MRIPWNKGRKETRLDVLNRQSISHIGKISSSKGKILSISTRLKISDKLKGRKLSIETRRKISISRKGNRLSEEHKNKISKTRIILGIKPLKSYKKGQISYMKGKKFTEEHKEKISIAQSGKKCKLWRGGHKKYRLRRRGWDTIRNIIYKRDNFSCTNCGIKNVKLNCHHIIPYRISKDDSFDNLTSLCSKCHAAIDFNIIRMENNERERNNKC